MTDEIIKLLDELAKRFGVAIDWADENVMPYLLDLIERFVDYKIASNILFLVLFAAFITITVFLAKKATEDIKAERESFLITNFCGYELSMVGWAIFAGLGLIDVVLFFTSINAITNLMELIFIPELYVAEWLKGQM